MRYHNVSKMSITVYQWIDYMFDINYYKILIAECCNF